MSDTTIPVGVSISDRASVYRKISIRILPFLIAAYLSAYLDRVNVSFAKLQMQSDLQFSDAVYGLGAGIFFIGYFLLEIPSNLALHRFGARVWIARIMITWAVISGLTAFATTPLHFYVLRFLLGLAEAGFSPGIIYYMMQWFPAPQRGRANAWYFIAIPLSSVIGAPFSGWIMHDLNGLHGLAGWQWLFLLEAVPSLLLGLVTLFYLDDKVEHAKWLTATEKEVVRHDLANENKRKDDHGSIMAFARDGRIWLLSGIYFCSLMGTSVLTYWTPSIIKAAGVTNTITNGLLTAVPYAVTIVVILISGRVADATRRRRLAYSAALTAGIFGLLVGTLDQRNLGLTMVGLTIASCGLITSVPLFWPLPPNFLRGATAAAAMAGINSIGNLAGFVSPYALGWLNVATGNAKLGLYLSMSFVFVAVLLVRSIPRHLVDR